MSAKRKRRCLARCQSDSGTERCEGSAGQKRRFTQFFVLSSLAGLLLSGCGNVAAQEQGKEGQWSTSGKISMEAVFADDGPRVEIVTMDCKKEEKDCTHELIRIRRHGSDKKPMLTVHMDGSVDSTDPAVLDESARIFWKEVAEHYPAICEQVIKGKQAAVRP